MKKIKLLSFNEETLKDLAIKKLKEKQMSSIKGGVSCNNRYGWPNALYHNCGSWCNSGFVDAPF